MGEEERLLWTGLEMAVAGVGVEDKVELRMAVSPTDETVLLCSAGFIRWWRLFDVGR